MTDRPAQRPRDRLGRPLPYGSAGVPPLPEGLPGSPRAVLRATQELLDTGLYFQAHELLEGAWKAAPTTERGLWRGLTQIVVGLVHTARGNHRGAARLLRRGLGELASYPLESDGTTPGSTAHTIPVDLPGVTRWARDLLARLESDEPSNGCPDPPRLLTR
ncbi:hypothetical protein UG55_100554 [Frankia sp. EI5c]|uniref:DUF309 domain-containing protein n=1 Tax=Frankia sp. EI5c TaxID=683316 RepID=UPI0007C3BE94|nr:DUF309 domain-containing protein [Frankia sp. EI5c]OAA28542.1 hypothetical protein UG55_100554 [Frankia sp. EI5c]